MLSDKTLTEIKIYSRKRWAENKKRRGKFTEERFRLLHAQLCVVGTLIIDDPDCDYCGEKCWKNGQVEFDI